jgi:hypothetical protein
MEINMVTEHHTVNMNQLPSTFDQIGDALFKALEGVGISRLGLSAAVLASAAMMSGCSPQNKSYWSSTYTNLPAPPAEARMQLGVSTEDDGTVFINYVVWDADRGEFARKDIHYTTTVMNPGSFQEAGGYKQKVYDGEVIYGDAIVDQKAGKIILSNGNVIDGKTGNIVSPEGEIIKQR